MRDSCRAVHPQGASAADRVLHYRQIPTFQPRRRRCDRTQPSNTHVVNRGGGGRGHNAAQAGGSLTSACPCPVSCPHRHSRHVRHLYVPVTRGQRYIKQRPPEKPRQVDSLWRTQTGRVAHRSQSPAFCGCLATGAACQPWPVFPTALDSVRSSNARDGVGWGHHFGARLKRIGRVRPGNGNERISGLRCTHAG